MSGYHIAQINIARFVLPKQHADNIGFMKALDPINALADTASGFVWRLVGEGNDAINIDAVPDDPRLAINMSVWTDVESLGAFVYRNPDHLAIMRRRREWLEQLSVYQALWWVPRGHIPSVQEGIAKIAYLAQNGPTSEAFTLKHTFHAPDGMAASPLLDDCA